MKFYLNRRAALVSLTLTVSIGCVFLAFFTGCSKTGDSDDSLSSLSDFYIPDFTNGWKVIKGNPNSLFFIHSTNIDSSKGTGLIEGSEDINGDVFNLKGNFQNIKVSLSYLTDAENLAPNGPHAGFSYSGKYDTLVKPFIIRLVNINDATDSLVIQHG